MVEFDKNKVSVLKWNNSDVFEYVAIFTGFKKLNK